MIFSSLGSLCHSAKLLERNNLKIESHPFDWIRTNTEMVEHCISDDYKSLLNKDLYIEYKDHPYIQNHQTGHSLYSKMVDNEVIFQHYNPLKNQSDYDYFERCVNRFRSLLKKEEKKLFLFFDFANKTDYKKTLDSAIKLSQFIGNHTVNYKLLFINNEGAGYTAHEIKREKNLYFLDLKTKKETLGQWFDDEDDNIYLDNILKDIIKEINI